jgi:hypothetical protein
MRNFFYRSAIAIPQLEGKTSSIGTPQIFKEMLVRNCNFAIPRTDKQAGGQTDRQAGGQTDRQAGGQTDRQTRQTGGQDRQTARLTDRRPG